MFLRKRKNCVIITFDWQVFDILDKFDWQVFNIWQVWLTSLVIFKTNYSTYSTSSIIRTSFIRSSIIQSSFWGDFQGKNIIISSKTMYDRSRMCHKSIFIDQKPCVIDREFPWIDIHWIVFWLKLVAHEFGVFKIHFLRLKIGYFYYPVIFDYPAIFSKTCAQHDNRGGYTIRVLP